MTPVASPGKLQCIDSARGIAILLVILVHTSYRVPGLGGPAAALMHFGQWGVQLFFVVSAYKLCASQQARASRQGSAMDFYLRRFFRIAPLYYVGILLYGAIHGTLMPRPEDLSLGPYSAGYVAAHLLFAHGFVPWAMNNVVPGGWSIGTEMAFYLLFPLLYAMLVGSRLNSAWRTAAAFAAAIGVNMAVQFALSDWSDAGRAYSGFMSFNLVNNLPVFLLGFWLHAHAQASPALPGRDVKAEVAWSWLTFAGFAAATLALNRSAQVMAYALVPTMAGLAFVGLVDALRLHRWRLALLVAVGKVSYSMYLLHFLFASLLLPVALRALPAAPPPELLMLVAFPLVTALTYVMAVVSERLIEAPGIALGGRLARRLRARRERRAHPLPSR